MAEASMEIDLQTRRERTLSSASKFESTVPQNESASWLAQLDSEKRAKLRELHQVKPIWNLVIFLYPLLWAAAATTMLLFPNWPTRLAGYVVIGISIHAMAVLMHEGIHGTLFRNRRLDRWVGFVLGAPALFSCMAYKVAHLAHHRHNRTEKDPDEFTNYTNSRLIQSILFYGWAVFGMVIYLIHIPVTALRRGKPFERRIIVMELLLLAAIYAAVIVLAARVQRLDLVLHLWIIPMIVATVFANVRGWAEHAMTCIGDPLTQTRTVMSNRLVSFLMCNLNYHLEHHLCPGIPWYNLPKLHALLQPEFRQAGAFIYKSYLKFIWDALRTGVHGFAPKPPAIDPSANSPRLARI